MPGREHFGAGRRVATAVLYVEVEIINLTLINSLAQVAIVGEDTPSKLLCAALDPRLETTKGWRRKGLSAARRVGA